MRFIRFQDTVVLWLLLLFLWLLTPCITIMLVVDGGASCHTMRTICFFFGSKNIHASRHMRFLTSTNARKMQHNNGSACQAVETKSTDVEYWSLPYSSLMLLASILHAFVVGFLPHLSRVRIFCLHCFPCLPHDSGHNAKELVNGDVRVPQHRSK